MKLPMISSKRSFIRALFFGAVPLGLAACGGGGGSNASYYPAAPPVASQITPTCAANSGATIQEVYPAVGSSGITNPLSKVVLAASKTVQSTGYVILVPNGATLTQGSYAFGGVVSQSSGTLPMGTASPSFSNPIYYASPNQSAVTLPVNVLISVYFGDTAVTCNPALLGTFST